VSQELDSKISSIYFQVTMVIEHNINITRHKMVEYKLNSNYIQTIMLIVPIQVGFNNKLVNVHFTLYQS